MQVMYVMITHIITENFVIGFKHMVFFIGYVLQVMAVEMTSLSYYWLVLSPMVVKNRAHIIVIAVSFSVFADCPEWKHFN